MRVSLTDLRTRAANFVKHRRTRKTAIWLVVIVAGIGVIGALIAPPLVRKKLAGDLTKTLHREVSIEQIRINPYALSVAVRGFLVKERQSTAPALSFDELYINLQLSSLFQRGAVLKEIRLVKPYVNLVRNEDFTYNFTDLIEEFTKGPPGGPTPRFSLNNIEVVDGRIDFDDRPEGVKHAVESIRLGVPFVSSIPYYTDVKVQPAFAARVNGSPLEIGGETKPFKDSRESTIQLEIDKLQIPKYLEYSPVQLNFKMPSGQLDGELTASFRTTK
ncbi:MAG: AsmA family protein, partial [Candidatus Binatia bacterium]